MPPPQDPNPRQPSRPDEPRPAFTGVEKPAPDVLKRAERRYDANATAAPKRSPTLTGLVAPPAPGSVPPPAPRLPGELAPTLPAKANPLQHQTVQRPAPPSAMRRAVQSDPPAAHAPSPAPISPGIEPRVVEYDVPISEAPADSLPPASQRVEDGRIAALQRRAETAERKLEQARRAPTATATVTVTDSIRPDGSIENLRKAQTKAWLGIAALLALLALPLYNWIDALAKRTERVAVQAQQASTTAAAATEQTGKNSSEKRNLEQEFRQYRSNQRALLKLMGVDVPKHEGDPEAENLDPMTPYCAPGKICQGPQLVLRNAP